MKAIFLILASGLIFCSCQKDKLASRTKSQIQGAWEYEQSSGYPFTNTYEPPGNGRIIILSKKGNFERWAHDTLLFKGNYFLEEKKDCYEEKKKVYFTTNDTMYHFDSYITIENDKLVFSSSQCLPDFGITYYRRISSSVP